ncbi:helix-turn-helix transcriptional regulator [Cohnella herbarum]|uniref:AAA family ATPase n=1 Tax=Cohnella herbarum TaxID=2728023 RepID=A0A7Z2VJW7_9BACL|nr:LuxR C-terminal-related transcriptional regulator [Cohnella herbarum]QJD84452.1 AAA family ATPase [Cohnella herbarum]
MSNAIDLMEQHYLVGRDDEVAVFNERLGLDSTQERIINVYGTGGIGKSFLLNEFRRHSEQDGAMFLLIDGRVFVTPQEFCYQLLRALRYPINEIPMTDDLSLLTDICLDAMHEATGKGKTVLALDTFEEFGDSEHWLREEFLARISPRVLIVISGRLPLQGRWLYSPAWRNLIYRMPLSDLDYESVKRYLVRSGIDGEETVHRIWVQTKGHPLTLALFASTTLVRNQHKAKLMGTDEIFVHVVNVWLKEVPEAYRMLVETASALRHFNQELLSFVLEKPITANQFKKLAELSFVQRADRGWLLHDLLRDAVSRELRLREPDRYERLWKRCVLYYYYKIKNAAGKKSVGWDNAEWFYYIGDQLIQSAFYQHSLPYSSEPLTLSNWKEAEQYIDDRYRHTKDVRIPLMDPNTGEPYEYLYKAEVSLYGLKHIHLKELFELDTGIVKLTRDSSGIVRGLSAIIPINGHTLDYLKSKPLSSAYFNSLSQSELNALNVPRHTRAGYFFKTLDVHDSSDLPMLQWTGITFISHILSSTFIVAAPPPDPFCHSIFYSLGCQITKNVVHFDYEDRTPAPLFVIDTRGEKLHDYLKGMIASNGIVTEDEERDIPSAQLTVKEREIVELIVKGHTNMEIANLLFISEATVKKHLSNIFKKWDIKSRTRLINFYLKSR